MGMSQQNQNHDRNVYNAARDKESKRRHFMARMVGARLKVESGGRKKSG